LVAAKLLAKKLIVICPAIAKQVWLHEANEIDPSLRVVILDGVKFDRNERRLTLHRVETADVVLLNYDIAHAWMAALMSVVNGQILCLDESHKIRTPSNRWTQAIKPLALVAERVWELTGTAMVNSALDLYWQLGLFGVRSPFTGMRARDFGFRYCEKKWNPFKGNGKGDWDFVGVKDEERIVRAADASLQRRRKAECLDLPQKLRLALYLARHEQGRAAPHHSIPILANLATLRRRLSPEKARLTIDYLEQQLVERPVVVFGWHHEYLNRVALHFQAPVIDGETSQLKRTDLVCDFQAGKISILVGQIEAMGMAITLTAGRHAVFGECHWSAVSLRQAEDRLHRIGQHNDVTYHYLLVANTVEQVVWETALRKGAAIDRLDEAAIDLDELMKQLA